MGDVVQIRFADEKVDPCLEGIAVCLDCKKEWTAIAPIGTIWLECPKCGLKRGRYKFPTQRDGEEWKCNCGNDLFHIKPDGIYCPNCGAWQEGF